MNWNQMGSRASPILLIWQHPVGLVQRGNNERVLCGFLNAGIHRQRG